MNLKTQKRIAADVLKASGKRVWFNALNFVDIKEAITKQDIKKLIGKGIIRVKPKEGVSRGRARKILSQKQKGRRKGVGSRKGKSTARLGSKETWMNAIRAQRKLLTVLKEKGVISVKVYQDLRSKSKGGFFRSRRHIHLYLKDRGLVQNGKK